MDAEVTFRTPFRKEEGAESSGRAGLRPPTVAAVAALHMALIAILALLPQARQAPPPTAQLSIPVIFVPAASPPAEPPPQMLASSSLPVRTAEVPDTLAPLPAMILAPSHMVSMPRRAAARPILHDVSRPAPLTPARPAPALMLHPQTPPAPAVLAEASPDILRALASWEARIRQAVQDAAIYPASARLLHRQGSAQVRFDYDRGAIASATIAQSSHVGVLDTAALAAVTGAAIPNPPAELGPQKRTMLVWVQFQLRTEE